VLNDLCLWPQGSFESTVAMRADCTRLLLNAVEKEFLDVKGEAHSCNRHDGG
jgi:hypothetical protein